METPVINKTYNYFDDGKISESRREHVLITRLIKFEDATKKLVKEWKKEVKQCHWLYKTETDFFVEGFLKDAEQKVTFVRCKNEGWFSLGWYAGRLDIDGSLFEMMFKNQ